MQMGEDTEARSRGVNQERGGGGGNGGYMET